ncbi:hypothetical protein Agabi119p4_3527 [Agaricus bisporus var. burnettii]|uniref:Uncharacterized protein n=1 Tax=Agaricus bisporus var. burnettii TaxID=192524 RepID=A0A8H7F4X6_AGABI|nr:hypothetical protein Agabi119p4_3527 [Agaricus bisporus var. burnettii]
MRTSLLSRSHPPRPPSLPRPSPPNHRPARQAQQVRTTTLQQARPRCLQHCQLTRLSCLPQLVLSRASPSNISHARALLAKVSSSAPRPSSKRVPKPPTDPVKLAAFQKAQRMKMRHTAVPLDPKDKSLSPPLDQRLHIKVRYGEISKVFWLRKTLITGKALDLICGHFGVGPSDSVPRRLSIDGSDAQLLNDKPLSEQADDGSTLSLLR